MDLETHGSGCEPEKIKSERPVDALAVKKGDSLTDNLKSRDASASKNTFQWSKVVSEAIFPIK